jgi:hypothetical protein
MFADKEVFIQRCRDTSQAGQGFIIPLDDADLKVLAERATELQFQDGNEWRFDFPLLRERFDRLIS